MVAILHGTPEIEELVDRATEFRQLGSGFLATEGPAWNVRAQHLAFVDIRGGVRWRWSERDGVRLMKRPNLKGNGMVYEPDGSLLICEHVTSSVVRELANGDRQIVAYHFGGKYLNSPNDIVVRSDGSIYFTDPNYGRWPVAVGIGRECELDFQGVFRVPPGGGECELVVEQAEFSQPNGLCFSPDEKTVYVDDLDDMKAFDVHADGSLSNRRVFHSGMGNPGNNHDGDGMPDGMKSDERGNIWCTGRNGVWVLDPSGKRLGVIRTPEVTTNLMWGGPDLHTLFLTTCTTLHALTTRIGPTKLPHH